MSSILHNRASARIIEHLKLTGAAGINTADIQKLTGVKERMLDATLADALEIGDLCRRRVGSEMVYMLPPETSASTTTISRAAPAATKLDIRTVAEHTKDSTSTHAADARTLAERINDGAKPVKAAIGKLTATKPARRPPAGLPALDVSTLKIAMRPKITRSLSGPHKWDSFFSAMASTPIKQSGKDSEPEYPTVDLGPEYLGTLQQAARDWETRNKGRAAFKVSKVGQGTVVQRVA